MLNYLKLILLLFLMPFYSCQSNKPIYYVKPFISMNEVLDSFSSQVQYNIADYIKLSASINLTSFSKLKSFDTCLKLNTILIYDTNRFFFNLFPSDELMRLNNADKAYLFSLLYSEQVCYPSILRTTSTWSNTYSTVGDVSLFILANNDRQLKNFFKKSTNLSLLNRDSLINLIKEDRSK